MSKFRNFKLVSGAIGFSAIVSLILFTGSKQDLINKNTLAYSNLSELNKKIEENKKSYEETLTLRNKQISELNDTIKKQTDVMNQNNEKTSKQKEELSGLRAEMSITSAKYNNLNNNILSLTENKAKMENELKVLAAAKEDPVSYVKNNMNNEKYPTVQPNMTYSEERQKVIDLRNEALIVNSKLINMKQMISIEERKYNNLKLQNAAIESKIKEKQNN